MGKLGLDTGGEVNSSKYIYIDFFLGGGVSPYIVKVIPPTPPVNIIPILMTTDP